MIDRGAALRLIDRLARIELNRRRIDLARIRIPLRARQPERILRFRLVLRVADQRDARRVGRIEAKLEVRQIAPRR